MLGRWLIPPLAAHLSYASQDLPNGPILASQICTMGICVIREASPHPSPNTLGRVTGRRVNDFTLTGDKNVVSSTIDDQRTKWTRGTLDSRARTVFPTGNQQDALADKKSSN